MIYYFMKECFRKQKRNVLASQEAASDGFPSCLSLYSVDSF